MKFRSYIIWNIFYYDDDCSDRFPSSWFRDQIKFVAVRVCVCPGWQTTKYIRIGKRYFSSFGRFRKMLFKYYKRNFERAVVVDVIRAVPPVSIMLLLRTSAVDCLVTYSSCDLYYYCLRFFIPWSFLSRTHVKKNIATIVILDFNFLFLSYHLIYFFFFPEFM